MPDDRKHLVLDVSGDVVARVSPDGTTATLDTAASDDPRLSPVATDAAPPKDIVLHVEPTPRVERIVGAHRKLAKDGDLATIREVERIARAEASNAATVATKYMSDRHDEQDVELRALIASECEAVRTHAADRNVLVLNATRQANEAIAEQLDALKATVAGRTLVGRCRRLARWVIERFVTPFVEADDFDASTDAPTDELAARRLREVPR